MKDEVKKQLQVFKEENVDLMICEVRGPIRARYLGQVTGYQPIREQ